MPGFRRGVEVLRRYSNSYGIKLRVRRMAAHLREHPPESGPVAPPPRTAFRRHKLSQRLSAEAVSEIIASYRAGTTADELASRHGVARSSVTRLLHLNDVAVRR